MSNQLRMSTLKLLKDILSLYEWRVPVLIIIMVISAFVEGIGMLLLLPLLNSIGIESGTSKSIIEDYLNQVLLFFGANESTALFIFIVITVFIIQFVFFISQTWWISVLQRDYIAHWQKKIFRSVVYAKWSFTLELKLGAITNQIQLETGRIGGAFLVMSQFMTIFITASIYILLGCMISWKITLCMLAFSFFGFIFIMIFGRRTVEIGKALGPLASSLNVLLTEFIGAVKFIKITATEETVSRIVNKKIDTLKLYYTWAIFLPAAVKAIFEISAIICLCLVLFLSGTYFQESPGSILVIMALFVRLLPRLNGLVQNVQLLSIYIPAFDEAYKLHSSAIAVKEVIETPKLGNLQKVNDDSLSLNLVSAGYGDIVLLHQLKIDFPKTGLTCIVGHSGSGKSTLLNCILGLTDITSGTVTYAGADISQVNLVDWRKKIGYVAQDTVLFNSTIHENISWGFPNSSRSDVESAAILANAHHFISRKNMGYDLVLGDQGVKLSGGQRQRIGIARSLIGKPKILLLDEPTSALDHESASKIINTIQKLKSQVCIILVAHDLSMSQYAENIIFMSNGKILEAGKRSELLANKSYFYKLLKSQVDVLNE